MVFVVQEQKGRGLRDAFRAVAHQRDGSWESSGVFGWPAVRFMHHGVNVTLDAERAHNDGPPLFLQLHFGWAESRLRMEVLPEQFAQKLGKLLGAQDLIIGSQKFDRDYVIRGNDRVRIAELLSEPVQVRIEALRCFDESNDIYVGAKAGTLLIKKRGRIASSNSVNAFVRLGLELYDEIAGLNAEGIDFVSKRDSSYARNSSEAICQICGEAIEEQRVVCRSCKTPHHRDCWVYYGRCSTYGCGDMRYKDRRG